MGQGVDFLEGQGPVLEPAVRSAEDVEGLVDFTATDATGFLGDSIRAVREGLGDERAIIGFCGAPFTVASYMVEGRSSRNFENTKQMMLGEPETFDRLLTRVVDNSIGYLGMQVEAGADVLQVFDSWGGTLSAEVYRERILPHVERLVSEARGFGVPVILYVNGCHHLLEVMADSGAEVLGIDWRISPREAIERVGDRVALQGNLDPCTLFAPPDVVRAEARRVLEGFKASAATSSISAAGSSPRPPGERPGPLGHRPRRRPGSVRERLEVPKELLARYATSAPRYTSYPTAVDWEKDPERAFDPDDLRRAPGGRRGGAGRTRPSRSIPTSPTAPNLCLFCGCNVQISRSAERRERYLEAVEHELRFIEQTGIQRREVKQFHWGGGTPTSLDPDQLARLFESIMGRFRMAEGAEVSIEVDPRVTTTEQIERLAALGFNRISMGGPGLRARRPERDQASPVRRDDAQRHPERQGVRDGVGQHRPHLRPPPSDPGRLQADRGDHPGHRSGARGAVPLRPRPLDEEAPGGHGYGRHALRGCRSC